MTDPDREDWLETEEEGSSLGLRFTVIFVRLFGRRLGRAFVAMIAFYYVLFSSRVRRVSRLYLVKVDQPTGFWDVCRHVRRFAQVTLDRVFLVAGEKKGFTITSHGREHIDALCDAKRGALLIGGHVGSFEAMRAQGASTDLTIHVIGYFKNAKKVNAELDRISPENRVRLIEVDPSDPSFVLHVRDLVEAGGLVATLADRVVPAGARAAEVDFLGGRARFPVGPYALAAVIKCPVYTTFGLYRGGNVYDVFCEPFAERVKLPRKRRQEALEEYAQKFATRLERYCREQPDNWFNFYEFWEPEPAMISAEESAIP